MHRPPPPSLAALVLAATTLAACGAPRARMTRRPATAAERTAVVECAAAIALDEGFTVTERRPDLGQISAAWPVQERARVAAHGPKGGGDLPPDAGAEEPDALSDVLTVRIAPDPVFRALSLLVRASAQVGDSAVAPSLRAAVARDRIMRSCAYLVG